MYHYNFKIPFAKQNIKLTDQHVDAVIQNKKETLKVSFSIAY